MITIEHHLSHARIASKVPGELPWKCEEHATSLGALPIGSFSNLQSTRPNPLIRSAGYVPYIPSTAPSLSHAFVSSSRKVSTCPCSSSPNPLFASMALISCSLVRAAALIMLCSASSMALRGMAWPVFRLRAFASRRSQIGRERNDRIVTARVAHEALKPGTYQGESLTL